jgi:hypothetical protein
MTRASTARSIKKAISLPVDLAEFIDTAAREDGKSASAVVQDAMRAYRLSRLRGEYRQVQTFWSDRAREKGILTEKQLAQCLARKG